MIERRRRRSERAILNAQPPNRVGAALDGDQLSSSRFLNRLTQGRPHIRLGARRYGFGTAHGAAARVLGPWSGTRFAPTSSPHEFGPRRRRVMAPRKKPLDQQIVVITGATSGIGSAIAQEAAARRATIVLAGTQPRRPGQGC